MIRLPLVCLILAGLSPDDTVVLRPHWKVGDTVRYEVSKSMEKRKGEEVVQKGSSTIVQTIEVREATEAGYLLKVSNGKVDIKDPRAAKDPMAREMAKLVEGLELMVEVDRDGVFGGVRNWEAVRRVMRQLTEMTSERLRGGGIDETTLALLRKNMNSMFQTKQQVENTCTREIQFLFATLGIPHDKTSPTEYDVVLPNPLGGDPFSARATFTLAELEEDRARIVFDQSIPRDEARRVLEKTLEDLAKRLGKELPEGEFPDSVSIDDHGEFWVDTGTGWLRSVSWKRTSKLGEQARIDTIRIRRKAE
jgi:hypothetical protein